MIGGNITATIQCRVANKNKIGEDVESWEDVIDLVGFLDYSGGEYDYSRNAKMANSTHVFVCDYRSLKDLRTGGKWKWDPLYLGTPDRTDTDYGDYIHPNVLPEKITITPRNSRMVVDGVKYDMVYFDDPMNLHKHLEIFLKVEDYVR